jgi:hypothetical protein
MNSQSTNKIFLVEPVAFGYNAETAKNNYFQQRDNAPGSEIHSKALTEFNNFAMKLREHNIDVKIFKDTVVPLTPDSIFPNNWISFHADKTIALYPMFAKNRRLERRSDIIESFEYERIVDYSVFEKNNLYLEGTGSMILDRVNKIAYAALSERTSKELFMQFCADFSYEAIYFNSFHTVINQRLPIYHTNVMMSVADKYAIVCLECIDDEYERKMVVDKLNETKIEIIEISEKQVQSFAGNMLQLRSAENEKLLVMSQCAFDSLTPTQITKLKTYNEFIVASIPTIEKYGGGSVRCMIAEIF